MEESELKFVRLNDLILKLVPPVFIVIGTVSNVILMIITSKKVSRSSFMMFIFAVNVLDTVGLYTEPFWLLIHHWIYNNTSQLATACEVVLYMYNFVVICTGWITVYICFEQASKLCFQGNGLITRKKGVFLLITTLIISCGLNVYIFLNEHDNIREVSLSSMMCNTQPNQEDDERAAEYTSVVYKFNWKWLNKLISCFFPVTFTLACLIAIKQGMKTLIQSDSTSLQVIPRTLRSKEREDIKLASVTGIMLIVSTIPLAFYKTQASDFSSAKMQLISTFLSFLVHMNFAAKLVYFCIVSPFFRKNVYYLFKTNVIAKRIRRLSTVKEHSAAELVSHEAPEVQVHLEEACSDTESIASVSPLDNSETTAFVFNKDLAKFETEKTNASEC